MTDEERKALGWRGAPFPTSGRIIFAVPVYCSASTANPGAFSHWDVWADDAGDDWGDEREIGWRMSDATMWMPCPEEPGND